MFGDFDEDEDPDFEPDPDEDDCDYVGLWRGAVDRATFGARGQRFLRKLRDALDAMPMRRLITNELVDAQGDVCALGAVDPAADVDSSEPEEVAAHFGIARALACEIVYMNDEFPMRASETPEERWKRMRAWVEKHIGPDE